jgi:hypothetical protein
MTALLPVAAAGLLAVLVCRPSLYAWTSSGFTDEAASPLRQVWLNRPFFLIRTVIYLGAWLAFAVAFLKTSRRQPAAGHAPRAQVPLAAAFLVVFAITCWLSSHDWIMSLEPEWTSTMFGVYNFGGMFLSSLAAIIVVVLWGSSLPGSRFRVTEDQLHDLGTLLFAFSSFWMYLWFCQYWLIWYANIPEETVYFIRRSHDNWPAFNALNLVFNWGVPFSVLLFRSAKRNRWSLGIVAALVLVGRWLDLYLMIFPALGSAPAAFGMVAAGLLAGGLGLFLLAIHSTLFRAATDSANAGPATAVAP